MKMDSELGEGGRVCEGEVGGGSGGRRLIGVDEIETER